MVSDHEIVRSCLAWFEDRWTPDPNADPVWCFTEQEIRQLLMLVIERTMEREECRRKSMDEQK